MKKNKFRISHIHVWDKTNKGDLAIVLAVHDELKDAFRGAEIVDFPMEVLSQGKKSDLDKINKTDLVVIGGGGILYRYFLPFDKKFIGSIKPTIAFFSVGYIREVGSRKLTLEESDSIKYIATKAKLVGIRDYYTKRFMQKLCVKDSKLRLVGDSAILLHEKKDNIKLSKKINIGLNLNYSGWLGFGQYEREILESYEEVARYFQKKHSADIYYLMHHPGEKNIIKKLRIPRMKIVDIDPHKQKHFYGRLDLVIGMMLHSCVMTFGAGTPEINVAYDIRNKNFAKFIGCPELAYRLDDLQPGKLLARAVEVYSSEERYRKKFKKRIEKISAYHADFFDDLKKIINYKD